MSDYKLYLGNLETSTSQEEIKLYFEQFGSIIDVLIPLDRKTKVAKNYAFITFNDEESAKKALKLDGEIVFGQEISLQKATDKPPAKPKKKRHIHKKRTVNRANKRNKQDD